MRFEVLLKFLVKISSALAVLGLVIMMLASVADVVMANLFNRPLTGTFDLVETTLVFVVFLGFPATFVSNGHIAVDVVDMLVSPRTVKRLKRFAVVISLVCLVFLAWQMINPAMDAYRFGEKKQELGIPNWVLWVPMIFGIALSAAVLLRSFWLPQEPSEP